MNYRSVLYGFFKFILPINFVSTIFITIWSLIFCSAPANVLSHAHVWIHNALIVHFDEEGVAGFKVEWVFDEMFSNMIVHDFDKNGNGRFEPEEVLEVERGAFSNLKNYEYFMHVKINQKPFKVLFVKDFNAKIVKDRVVYHFFIPCHIKAVSSYKEIRIGVYDETFYTSVVLLEDQIFFENDSMYEHDHHIELNKDEPYYMGQVYPEEIVIRFKRRHD